MIVLFRLCPRNNNVLIISNNLCKVVSHPLPSGLPVFEGLVDRHCLILDFMMPRYTQLNDIVLL